MEDQFTVNLEGGRPWGFTLQGGTDFRSPLRVGRVSLFSQKYHLSFAVLCLKKRPCQLQPWLHAGEAIASIIWMFWLVCSAAGFVDSLVV